MNKIRVSLRLICMATFTLSIGCAESPLASDRSTMSQDKGLVRIYRDEWGIPYIFADQQEDGYFGVGYALAMDRPTRFFELVLWGTGSWGAARGNETTPLGIPATVLDDWAARWRHVEESKAAFARLDAQVQENYSSFARGFERYFDEYPELRPDWAPTVEGWHAIAVLRGLMWPFSMVNDGTADCARGGVRLANNLGGGHSEMPQFASNEWVVQRSRTADGKTILLSDPHGPIDGGFAFNEFNLRAGDLHFSTFAIGPIPVLAHTRKIAWAATTGAPDLSDCYAIVVDPENPSRYRFDGKWRYFETRAVNIQVKNDDPVYKEYEYSNHNGVLSPIMARKDGIAYVLSTPYMHEASSGVEEFEKFIRAEGVDDVFAALEDPKIFGQNYMFADADGNALYIRAGRTPIRPSGPDWTRPVDGNSSATEWRGIHSIRDLVAAMNLDQGYMKNTNEAPEQIVADASPIKRSDYPAYIYNDPGFTTSRAFRLAALLEDVEGLTVDDAMAIAFDEKLPYTQRWTSALALAGQKQPDSLASFSADEHAVFDSVVRFNGITSQTSTDAARYQIWRDSVARKLKFEESAKIAGDDPTQPIESLNDKVALRLVMAISDTVTLMQQQFGSIDVMYGDIWRLGRTEEDWPIGGGTICLSERGRVCEETLRAFSVRAASADDGRRRPQYGSRMMRLVAFGDDVEAFGAFNYGQSDDPDSPHYTDQARKLFSQKRLRRIYETEQELIRAGATKIDLLVSP